MMQKPLLLLLTLFLLSCGKLGGDRDVADTSATALVGSAAKELLQASPYGKLHIEVRRMEGAPALSDQALSDLGTFLAKYLDKPGGIEVVRGADFTFGKRDDKIYSISDVTSIEQNVRTRQKSGAELAVFVMVVDGSSTSANTLAHAYSASSIVIYGATLASTSANLTNVQKNHIQKAVLRHEFGHLLGLVNLGAPVTGHVHEDDSHPGHCSQTTCVMYYAVNTPSIRDSLPMFGGGPPDFDASCQTALESLKGP